MVNRRRRSRYSRSNAATTVSRASTGGSSRSSSQELSRAGRYPAANRRRPTDTAGLHGRGGEPGRLRLALGYGQVLYVRPTAGAWGTALLDGGVYDLDGEHDGAFEIALDGLVPVAGSEGLSTTEPPTEVAADDLIFVVDPTDLTLYSLRVTPDALH